MKTKSKPKTPTKAIRGMTDLAEALAKANSRVIEALRAEKKSLLEYGL
jgi:hypothetical protein